MVLSMHFFLLIHNLRDQGWIVYRAKNVEC